MNKPCSGELSGICIFTSYIHSQGHMGHEIIKANICILSRPAKHAKKTFLKKSWWMGECLEVAILRTKRMVASLEPAKKSCHNLCQVSDSYY